MKKILVISALALSLAGCATIANEPLPEGRGVLSPLVDTNLITEETRTKARQVQAKAKGICGFIPTIGTVISLFSAGIGGGAAAIGTAICDAVTSAPLADGGTRKVAVNGVPIKGKFVK